jgi:hypothetical protein
MTLALRNKYKLENFSSLNNFPYMLKIFRKIGNLVHPGTVPNRRENVGCTMYLTTVYTPGHSKHVYDRSGSGIHVFAGSAVAASGLAFATSGLAFATSGLAFAASGLAFATSGLAFAALG